MGTRSPACRYWRTTDSDTSRCFGNPYPLKTTAVLSDDGSQLTETVHYNTYTIATCAIVKTTTNTIVFKRVPSLDMPPRPGPTSAARYGRAKATMWSPPFVPARSMPPAAITTSWRPPD